MSKPTLKIRVVPAISEIAAQNWNGCASATTGGTAKGDEKTPYNPFISHEFLSAAELSKSATVRTGWQPQHLVAERDDGSVAGIVPCYLKSHSRGEYVFDRGWAEAYENAGGSYYPEAAGVGAVHARHRPSPIGKARRGRGSGSRWTAARFA